MFVVCERGALARAGRRGRVTLGAALGTLLACATAQAQDATPVDDGGVGYVTEGEPAPAPDSVEPSETRLPRRYPDYFELIYPSVLQAPLPDFIFGQGGLPEVIFPQELHTNPSGTLGSYLAPGDGEMSTADHAFFTPFGTNGRSCFTCHQPSSGMSISARIVQRRFRVTGGRDPIFAPVDGANCPSLVPPSQTSGALVGGLRGRGAISADGAYHSLLLERGLFRIFLPVPPKASRDYDVRVVHDPHGQSLGCNTHPSYDKVMDPRTGQPAIDPDTGQPVQLLSMFRRPRQAANLKFVPDEPTAEGEPSPGPRKTRLMWDGRETSLVQQARDATLGHAQALPEAVEAEGFDAELAEMVAFENAIFSAQLVDKKALGLGGTIGAGAKGGPVELAAREPANAAASTRAAGPPVAFDEFDAWDGIIGSGGSRRRSIERGQEIFNARRFTMSQIAGLNDLVGGADVEGTCSTCHDAKHGGGGGSPSDARDIGIGGHGSAAGGPRRSFELPQFEFTCTGPAETHHPFLGRRIVTNDPGVGLITGRCKDIGKFTVPPLRALAAREPYFHDGSAKTLDEVVSVYQQRFNFVLSGPEKNDLVNFLKSL